MKSASLKDYVVSHILPTIRMPSQYLGGEWNMVRKDPAPGIGRLCMAFPDTYTIGMSHHGLQVLYSLMNAREDWYCERAFAPWVDMEEALRKRGTPLYSLETFTPLVEFDVLGFSLQYEVSYINILTMLDLGGIPLRSVERTMHHPLVIAGGPCAQNPEPIAPFIDVFVTGDGEPSLPLICDLWRELQGEARSIGFSDAEAGRQQREELLARLAARFPFCYVPRFYEPEYANGRFAALHRTRTDVPATIEPSVISDLEGTPLPVRPIVPYVETVHDRISIEIMRGCPWQCRFCQSTVIKRPLRIRTVETIVKAAVESVRNTGHDEVSVLSLSSSDYPHFEQLIRRLKEELKPLGVNVSVPSLRVNEQLRSIAELIGNEGRSQLTLAPEVARDDMREQIRKKIKNEDLYEGCRQAFRNNFTGVKLYFLCGLPGERPVDLEGIVDMSARISRIGKEEKGHYAAVTAAVSNFVPKPHTPYQWNGMQTRDYFHGARHYMKDIAKKWKVKSVTVKCHDVELSMLEGLLSRGDRRIADVIEAAWRKGARHDSWRELFQPQRWWESAAECGLNADDLIHGPSQLTDRLPWDHVNVKYGRTFLEKEHDRSILQLTAMANAT